MAEYPLIPIDVAKIETKYRSIKTKIPVTDSIPIFKQLLSSEPRSMMGQPPVVWHKAENATIYDRWGNRWIDWSSGVLVTNAGHGRQEIKEALLEIIGQGLLTSYVFVHEKRLRLTKMLQDLSPDPQNYLVFLLTTGSEATECCIKLSKTYALEKYGEHKKYFVSFINAFHGRTLGAQLAGGIPSQKKWIGKGDPTFVQVPFPDGYKNEDTSFNLFLNTLKSHHIDPDQIAGVMTESYQGIGPDFLPVDYAQKLHKFCRENDIVLTMDEVQAGFGRTGKNFCFEHYGIQPDLIACGKGISSSLPLSAVIGRKDIMNLYAPGSMTSTHSASPLPVVSAIANLEIYLKEKLYHRAAQSGEILMNRLQSIQSRFPERLGCLHGKGLVAGIQVVKPGTKKPDSETALKINIGCFQKGLLMFAPVGIAGECIKICPPLTIEDEALHESLDVFEEAVMEVMEEEIEKKI
jgi:4-aminobutyrate aminotransferase/diaminobutyrate-pyruvate transaminase/4-aminobutyrate aminotransferase/(S)-3-amino-2-methylpropionate transaminase